MKTELRNLVWHDQRNSTGANREDGGRDQNLCSLRSLLFKSGSRGVVQLDFDKSISDGVNIYDKRDGDSRCSGLSTINSQPSTIQQLREYKAVYVQSDAEIGLFSDEVVVNCAP